MDDKRVIKVIKKVMPSVVSIAIAEKFEDLQKQFPKGFNPTIPDGTVDERGMVQTGGGSGFIVAPNGLILTNKHVVSEKQSGIHRDLVRRPRLPRHYIKPRPHQRRRHFEDRRDGLPCVRLGDATQLELGQSLIAIGNALGIFRNTVSVGIVSGLSRSITAQAEPNAPPQEMRGLIQTDAAINPGNSGGPIVDRDGCVVGVNAAIVSGAQSIGFAIPVNAARRDIDDIKKVRPHQPSAPRRPLYDDRRRR